jgi:DNA-binding CsgD family transcriptional regulator
MSKKSAIEPIASTIDRMEHRYLVGREREIGTFLALLKESPAAGKILSLHGTGGVGKSYLIDEFRRLSESAHVPFVYMDTRACPRNPSAFCEYLMRLLRVAARNPQQGSSEAAADTAHCVSAIRAAAACGSGRLVLALDNFEECGELEQWLREEFLTRLGPEVLTILSGRHPLQGVWLSSPAWREMVIRMPLGDLSQQAVRQYLELAGIGQAEAFHAIWNKTHGHPLTLSLFAYATLAERWPAGSLQNSGRDIFPQVVSTWLKEVPDPEIREMVEAAAVMRHFNQESLSYVMDKPVKTEQFLRLIGHSFIRRDDRGWLLHDLLRDAIGHELRLRAPDYYGRLWQRCVLHCCRRIKASVRNRSAAVDSTGVYYIGDRLIRTLFYQHSVTYRLESLHPANWQEAERYIAHRCLTARDTRILHTDPETNERFDYTIPREAGIAWFRHVDLQELYDLDPGIIKLIRDADDKVCGMAKIVPIHEGTLDYLASKPPFSGYYASLTEARRSELRTPRGTAAGYCIAAIDVPDYSDPFLRQAAGLTFITYMLSAGLVVTTSPAIPFLHSIFISLGFERVKDVVHYDYGDEVPTPYYALDTGGSKLPAYLDRMLASYGLAQDNDSEAVAEAANERMLLLSRRERDVVKLLLQGLTNSEIAGELILSEATAKKHVCNIFKKLQVKNRIQLMNRYREAR